MKLYLDNCCFNRPFDEQKFIKIKIETEAKLFIQEKIKSGTFDIIWSYNIDFENQANPFEERKETIKFWKSFAVKDIDETETIIELSKDLVKLNIKSKDALHLACAINAGCDYFITTDYEIIKKMSANKQISVVNLVDFINREVKHGS